MSKLQLRSKRKTDSPTNLKVQAKSDVPLTKKAKTAAKVDVSDSESSSDEFVRPSKDLKVNAGILLSRNGPSPVPDFSSIEKSIFSGVSKLSDSDSDDSDFEEVPAPSRSLNESAKDDSGILSNDSEQNSKVKTAVQESVKEKVPSKPVRSSRRKPATKDKDEAPKSKTEKQPVKKPADVAEPLSDAKGKGKGSRAVKRKNEEVENTSVSPGKQIKHKDEPEKKSSTRSSRSRPSTSTTKVEEEEKKPKGNGLAKKGKVCGKGEKVTSELKEGKTSNKVVVKEEDPANVDNLDIAQLLALGEGLKFEAKSEHSDSDSDEWEEVDPNEVKKHEIPKEGVQITLDMPEFSWRRKKQKDHQACLQAEMNRAFNRVRKELQLLCHKTSLLLWVAHGIFLNRTINSENVLGMALSLVPPDLCDLPKSPGSKYINKLLQWFATRFECSEGFPEDIVGGKTRALTAVLEQNFTRKYAKSTKEMTFMFVAVLRAVGIEARLVISFQPMPLKPQSDELLSINSKKRGRATKKETKEDSEAEDDPAPVVSSPYFEKKGKASVSKETGKAKAKGNSGNGNEKLSKSGGAPKPSSSAVKGSESNVKGRKQSGKSDPATAKSPPKVRELRRKSSKKSYSEKTDSDNEDSDDEEKELPILSPGRKKDDKTLSERLKAAAAKRTPTNRRFSLQSTASKARKSTKDSDSDFEPEPKRDSGVGSSRSSTSPKKKTSSRRSQSENSESDSDSDFEKKPKASQSSKKATKKTPPKGRQSKGRPSKSKDDDSGKKKPTCSGFDYWIEVYLKDDDRWTCVDVPSKKVDSTKNILAKATQPVCYVIAFNVDGTLKDVTKRYSPKFSQVTAKQRVSADWWSKSLKPFAPKHSAREAAEDSEMNLVELDRPMPKTVAECKNHPLYVLTRHLLKFEAIYPPDSPSLGFVRSEPIYARQNVYTLRSRETWMKEAKVVRLGEKPYKVVKQPKWDRLAHKMITDRPLEVFGPWQVEDYVPPPAVDGKVPRNAYGNVELFKPTMLPKGTVHLQVPSLSRVAKKLQIDCAPAVVGFDYHSGGCHPTFDGFVVCEEFVDVLMDAWNKDIDESAKRREEKHEKRIYGNWRRLIKGLLIREALKARYDFNGEAGAQDLDQAGSSQPSGSKASVNPEALQAARIVREDAPVTCLFPKLMANIRAQKTRQKRSAPNEKKKPPKGKNVKQSQSQKGKGRKKRKDETSEEEESDWDSTTTEEDDVNMVLLSDEDSGSEFEDLKR
ncbi:DNA repair protein complementing XP-C cells homolog isoform X2 [Thrips palmi]|uniref:DNA repair protein complementing XP-C cells homolog isoform X2 n=1 Tax=Thrips palmi TaxID=161013 RepID=A0A6P8YW52_THRPL|nr:DNA repair protein complementing XP-C cells homolog isoform X2 [Thrips palmi]